MKTLSIDIETYASTDLSKCGVYQYAESPDFEILLFGYSVDGGIIKVIDLASGEYIPTDIVAAISDPEIIKWAFNAQFERICLSRWLQRKGYQVDQNHPDDLFLSPSSWRCTMVWSAYLGLPLSLEGAGIVLGLEKQKLREGKELIRYFCQPCLPTKTNGRRSRNLPEHAPEKWLAFKAYNARDVEVELAIQDKLRKYPVPDFEWQNYCLDQIINDRGIQLDITLVQEAIRFDQKTKHVLTQLMRQLTALENPNSVAQLKAWLSDQGLETDTLGKSAVKELLKTAPEALGKILELRQSLAKSSIKKYTAMNNAVCSDGRLRGLLQFYGANRTGRWAGRLVQVQNLPQNHLPDLVHARQLVRSGNYEALEMLFDSVPDVLSELIRTAFVPKPGHQFIVADFSAIEARVIAWLAGEQWKMDVFAGDGRIYEATASRMFNVPIDKITKGSELRQKAKQAELACIAEGELVLTDLGLVPIENITKTHKLWDGESWIPHGGLIRKGFSEVICYDELTATPDHLVWVEGQSQPIQFGVAAALGARLVQTGNGRDPIRLGEDNQPGKALEFEMESLLCTHQVYRLWKNPVAVIKQFTAWDFKRLPALFTTTSSPQIARQTINSSKTTLRKTKRFRLLQLWRERHKVRFYNRDRSWPLFDKEVWLACASDGNRSHRQRKKLHLRKCPFCDSFREQCKQALHSAHTFLSRILALCAKCRNQKTITRVDEERDFYKCQYSSVRKAKKLENYQRKARLYDIRDAGKNHRFTVSGKLVHNCGYGGSVGALKAMGALEMGLAEEELQLLVMAWRATNPNIVRLWWDVGKAAMTAVKDRTVTEAHGIRFSYQSGILFITLPSGRQLAYVKPKIGKNQFGSDSVTYEGVGATKKWERIETYGPKLVENIIQAISRDILCYALQALSQYRIVMHVHDEIVIEAEMNLSLDGISARMSLVPSWAKGLLLRADGFVCPFYKKD